MFDTRARTLHIAQQFDTDRGTNFFVNLSLEQIDLDGTSTCERQEGSLSPETAQEFAAYWRHGFWDERNFIHDLPMTPVLDWVRAAQDAGLLVRFLTGRIVRYTEISLEQLHRAGIDFARTELLHPKPALDVYTVDHKTNVLRSLDDQGFVAWYITESRFEISSLQKRLVGFPLVLLDCSLERGGPAVAEDTLVLDSVF